MLTHSNSNSNSNSSNNNNNNNVGSVGSVGSGKRKSTIYTTRSTLIGKDYDEENEIQQQTLELEKLEQEITLTLQDMDRNLSKSNKILNDNVIPIIQEYSKNSKNLWANVSFWKNFFEDSANVQFSGADNYDDLVNGGGSGNNMENANQDRNSVVDKGERSSPIKSEIDELGSSFANNSISTNTADNIQQRYYNQINTTANNDNDNNNNNPDEDDDEGEDDSGHGNYSKFPSSTPNRKRVPRSPKPNMNPSSSPTTYNVNKTIFNKENAYDSVDNLKPPTPTHQISSPTKLSTNRIFTSVNEKRALTPNKRFQVRPVISSSNNRFSNQHDAFSSPDIPSPPKITSMVSPTKNKQLLGGIGDNDDSNSINIVNSPPRTIHFAPSKQELKKTPSRVAARNKTHDMLEIVGGNDSSSMVQNPPQFTLPNTIGNDSNTNTQNSNKGKYELDSLLDSKYKEFNETNNIDWSDE
ncbi:hypothetical protein PACTADRAFT_82968 [Pachysolen tannophilus NRRL Y-2460]|uniref:DASH complex subunit ASK1 n=1 Tax=Pachysolen tannophilus NRRL Y-2460 TaxID=669874 RepID=A0A1E4U0G1_PACTA|nr:hypothetical protein PACTADRAFT_82968 [Pachysolen tannophilus NRRL Y-2460]